MSDEPDDSVPANPDNPDVPGDVVVPDADEPDAPLAADAEGADPATADGGTGDGGGPTEDPDVAAAASEDPGPGGRIEPVDLQQEMQRSYLDYAMSVIVGRALPDVRDGLKPVHRRVLYAMSDGGYRPDRPFSKSSRVVGDVMGQYHPHGDSAIYDALVRLAQPWSLRYPLVHGQGNFGSPGDDRQAAMRYCLTADTRVRTADRGTVRIADLADGLAPNSDAEIDVKLLDRDGNSVHASKLFHSGLHPTLRVQTREGYALTGTHNHPVLVLESADGVPTIAWRMLSELQPGDHVVLHRRPQDELGDTSNAQAGLLAGAFVSEGFVSETRAGFNNVDAEYFDDVLAAYDAIVGGRRYVYDRVIASGSRLYELDVQNLSALRASVLAPMIGHRSAAKRVPEFVWTGSPSTKQSFLRSLFTGYGSCSTLARGAVQVSYSTRSSQLASEVQQLLLEFGVVSRHCRYANGEHKVYIGNRRDVRLFAQRVGFLGAKQRKLETIVAGLPIRSSSMSADHVPHLAPYLRRAEAARSPRDHSWLKLHNVDRIERWADRVDELVAHLTPAALAVVEPLVDGRYYFAAVTAVEDAGVQAVYSPRVDSDTHDYVSDGFVSHNTECRMAPLAMEMVRDIDEETVDFSPNYDGRQMQPDVLPSRFPNLLVNGSGGIAVGMATNIPPHNLREVASGVQWYLENPEAPNEELLEQLLSRVSGPDFPTRGLIVGRAGIEEAYRTGRGSVTMRAVVEVEEDSRGRTCLIISELPYQVNPDALARKIADLADRGKVPGIADLRDDSSSRTGMRIVVVLKRDAVASVVRNNLYKHTQLQDTFGCNMVALVDGVPRTLSLDGFVRYWVRHQIEVIQRRTRYRLREAENQAHIYRAYVKALDALDEVIALIRRSTDADAALEGLKALLEIDDIQARAILEMQLRRLAALERQRIIDHLADLQQVIAALEAILASEQRQREIVSEELAEIVERYGDERRTQIIPAEGDMSAADFITEEDVVVTITRGGYAKRTRADLYRAQRRGGKGVRGAQLRQDDIVEHFFVTSTHDWLLFFTNEGRVYRARAYELPDLTRDARGQHVANLLEFSPDERIAQVLTMRDYDAAPYLVLATRYGRVKKTRLTDYDSPRSRGIIAVVLNEGDELIAAELASAEDDLLLVSRKARSVRFTADDESLRPMGRATAGVRGMRFVGDDELLSMSVVRADREDLDVFVVTDGGFAKRTPVSEYRVQGRGGLGILAARVVDQRGSLVGALVVDETDEVLAITSGGGVIRTRAADVRRTGRATMGVRLINLAGGDTVVAIARNAEADTAVADLIEAEPSDVDAAEAEATVPQEIEPEGIEPEGIEPEDTEAEDTEAEDTEPEDTEPEDTERDTPPVEGDPS